MYTFDGRIRYSEVGEDRRLTVSSLIDYFQDCSTFQSEDLGLGLDYLAEHRMAWLVIFWQLEIFRLPALAEKIRTGTSPYEMKSFMGYRNFMMETRDGERLVNANSVWTLMDTETMRPVRVPQVMIERYVVAEPFEMRYRPRKIQVPEGMDKCGISGGVITVEQQHLDSNHHVNNGQYVRFAMNMVPEGAEIETLCVEYRKQARLGDRILPVAMEREEKGERSFVILLKNDKKRDEVFAAAEMTIRP